MVKIDKENLATFIAPRKHVVGITAKFEENQCLVELNRTPLDPVLKLAKIKSRTKNAKANKLINN